MAKRKRNPRQLPQLKTANDKVLDKTVKHQHSVERFKTGVDNKTVSALNKELRPLSNEIRDILEKPISRVRKEAQVLRVLDKRMAAGFVASEAILITELTEFGTAETLWLKKTIDSALKPLDVEINLDIPKRVIRELIKNQPIHGQTLTQWFKGISQQTADKIRREINNGIANNFGVDRIVRGIRGTRINNFTDGILNTPRRHLVAVTRTAVNDIASQVKEEIYKANDDIVDKVQYVATLDARTTDICASLDGTTWQIGVGPRPPMHMQCRSTTVPVIKSWQEMGFDFKDVPEGTRASINGQVASSITYPKWLKQQSRSTQNEVLGTTRARLWRSGKVEINSFVDDRFRPLTLSQLATQEGIELP